MLNGKKHTLSPDKSMTGRVVLTRKYPLTGKCAKSIGLQSLGHGLRVVMTEFYHHAEVSGTGETDARIPQCTESGKQTDVPLYPFLFE